MKAARSAGVPVISDGGVKFSGDVAVESNRRRSGCCDDRFVIRWH